MHLLPVVDKADHYSCADKVYDPLFAALFFLDKRQESSASNRWADDRSELPCALHVKSLLAQTQASGGLYQ